ncbi:MAG TPA: HEAT repeat domain-containing protein [Sandaracinaceae bacterium LLY-WYZ-13_1]|nr:HEAT repeat domain-containing protein [Sandaracinaceae bacterium LLY-WYZ-13_1]
MRRWTTRLLVLLLALTSLGFEWEGRLTRLRRELGSEDPVRRREVVELLSSYPAAEVDDALLRALEDPDAGVRAEAAQAVGRVRLREAVPRLLDWLDDSDADVRAAAARALGQIGEQHAIPNLVRVLGDSHAEVRRAGVAALAAIGGDEVVVPLLGRLDDVDARVRVEAANLLGRLGDPRAVVPLVGRARDDAPEVRAAVYSALGDLGDPRAVPALVQGIRDDAPEPRLAAIAALGRLGSAEAVRPLVALLESNDPRVSRAVTAALGQIPAHRALEALVITLGGPRTRIMAARALVERARRDARSGREDDAVHLVRALADALDDADDPHHATQIASTLGEVAAFQSIRPASRALLGALREGRGEPPALLRALGATGDPEALVPLLERLRADDVAVRMAVLEALRRYFDRAEPDGRAADPLLAVLGEVTEAEREPVVALLGTVRARRALPALRTLLDHHDPELRLAAIRAIGAIGDPEGAPALLELLDDHDGRLRFEAASAVGAAASPALVTTLLDRLVEREPTDRHALLMALAHALPRLESDESLPQATSERALRLLLRMAQADDGALAARALDVVVAWRPPRAAPRLVAILERAGPRRRIAIARALGALDHDASRAALRDLLTRPSVSLQTQAASVLGEHGGTTEAQLLLERAPDLPWPASAAAAFSLARLARRGILESGESTFGGLCRLGTSHDPFVRANVAIALAALSAPPCPSGAHPLAWLERRHAAVVRAAAARWAHSAAESGHIPTAPASQALDACAAEPLAAEVAEVCARPTLPPMDAQADVFAHAPDGERLLASRLVALRLADGTVWLTRTDANGHLRLHDAPRGPLSLEDPAATPLEP